VNRPIPKLGSVKAPSELSEKFIAGYSHIALPIVANASESSKKDTSGIAIDLSQKLIKSLEKIFEISFTDEIRKASTAPSAKAGEIIDIPVPSPKSDEMLRVILVGIGEKSDTEIRKAGAAIGRKVRGTSSSVLSFLNKDKRQAQISLIASGLATYSWGLKTGTKPEKPKFTIVGDFEDVVRKSSVLLSATWRTRDLIHTPSNIKSPEWMAEQSKKLAKGTRLSVKVRSGKELQEFGGLRAVGNSSKKNPPRFVEVSYKPQGSTKVPHVVLVGKGITFDTGGVSLKRPYDTMTAMKSDMSGAAAVLMVAVAAAELGLKARVTALMMLAENALSGSSQRPSDVITHYGGTTVEVINTDAEGRLVLADGLSYADENLNPDYLIDVATLTGAATLGLSRFYGAMYTRNTKLAHSLSSFNDISGDRVWHMPLIDDYQVALASDVADYNHTADKFKFQGGSVTAALFLEKFVGARNWVHLDIAGPARSEVDAGENVKGGTGFGVRLLTEWIASL
jgi:leucyl aminopeptidase